MKNVLMLLLGLALIGSPAFAQTDASALVDSLLAREWERRNLKPSAQSSDAEFVRRVYLDVVGVIPSASECREFLSSNEPDKRRQLIDQLLRSSDFADHWANVWEVQLLGRRNGGMNVGPLRQWLHDDVFAKSLPFDDFARQLVSGQGRGAATFFARNNQPNMAVSSLTRTFLGVRMNCSECHDDKRGEWKQQDFWNLAAFFAPSRELEYERRVKLDGKEQVSRLRARARFLPGTPAVDDANRSPREQFAEWLTAQNNPWFTKAAVNRMWAHFFGRGLADPVDDFWAGTEASPPELLDALAREFALHDFDFRWLVRSLANSRAYQLTSRAGNSTSDPLNLAFTRAEFRPLAPEQLFNSMNEAVNTAGRLPRSESRLARRDQFLAQFVTLFANDENQEEKHFEGTVAQTLMLFNGEFVNQSIRGEQRQGLSAVFRLGRSDDDHVRELFTRTLARAPSAREADLFKRYLSGAMTDQLVKQGSKIIAGAVLQQQIDKAVAKGGLVGGLVGSVLGGILGGRRSNNPVDGTLDALQGVSRTRERLFEDLYWALLNSTEFLYNH